ncbi:hypothetical protein Tco_1237681 [Tanacetum coccineum]
MRGPAGGDCRHTCILYASPYYVVRFNIIVVLIGLQNVLDASAVQKWPVVHFNQLKSNWLEGFPLDRGNSHVTDECSSNSGTLKGSGRCFLGSRQNLEASILGERVEVVGPSRFMFLSQCLKEKRDAVRLIADRWKLSIRAAGWEPKRFIVVHVTPKSKAPSRILGTKGVVTRDVDVSALVLRFGGECELVWLNDKNAFAMFSDPAQAATAMRRLDHGSVYHGAAVLSTNGTSSTGVSSNVWGGGASTTNPWKKAVVQQEHSDSWIVAQEWVNPETSPWKVKEDPLITTSSTHRWSILEFEVGSSQESGKVLASNVLFENETLIRHRLVQVMLLRH